MRSQVIASSVGALAGMAIIAGTASAQSIGPSISIRHAFEERQPATDLTIVVSPWLDGVSPAAGQAPKSPSKTPGVVSSTLIGAGLGAGIWSVAAVRAAEGGELWAALLGAGIGGLSGFAGGGLVKATQVRHPVWQTILYTVAGGIVWTAAGAFVERADESYRNAGVYLTIGVVHGAATGGIAIAIARR